MFGAVFERMVDALPFEAVDELQLLGGEAVEHLFEDDATDHAGQVIAEAEMGARAERKVLGLARAVETELVGVLVDRLVAVGRRGCPS